MFNYLCDKTPECYDCHLIYRTSCLSYFCEGIRRAPDRGYRLTPAQTETALRNALRYIPEELHARLAPEFMDELLTRGKIYGYRFRPQGDLKAKPIDEYKGNCIEGKAFQVMIDNNLSFDIALYPYELVTYGETGQVCQNWMQYRLIKQYLEVMTDSEQTLVRGKRNMPLVCSSQSPKHRVLLLLIP